MQCKGKKQVCMMLEKMAGYLIPYGSKSWAFCIIYHVEAT